MRSAPARADFADAADYARTLWEYGGPSSPEAVQSFTRLGGPYGDLLRAVWGDEVAGYAEWCAEQRAEAKARPHIFVEKLPRGRRPSPATLNASLLRSDEVGEVLSAAEFAALKEWRFGASVTVSCKFMGAGSDAQVKASLERFWKCLGQWCRDHDLPRAYVAVVENGPQIGLHFHLAAHVPASCRAEFRQWLEGWVRAECMRWGVAYQPQAWRLNRYGKDYALAHFLLASYVVKGFDAGAVVQSATDAPDGRPVLLRDVLAYEYDDPGVVPFPRLYIGASINARARADWRSKWERGERDVNFLYPPDFLKYVRLRCPVAALSEMELSPVRAAALSLTAWCTRVRPWGDALPPEVQGWQTVVERNVEIAVVAFSRVHTQFALAAAMRDPQDRSHARAELRAAVEAAHRAVNENGAEVASLISDVGLPLGRLVVRRLAAAEVAVRELGALLGVDTTQPAWAVQAQLDPLGI